jgi:hypothetical protein
VLIVSEAPYLPIAETELYMNGPLLNLRQKVWLAYLLADMWPTVSHNIKNPRDVVEKKK